MNAICRCCSADVTLNAADAFPVCVVCREALAPEVWRTPVSLSEARALVEVRHIRDEIRKLDSLRAKKQVELVDAVRRLQHARGRAA